MFKSLTVTSILVILICLSLAFTTSDPPEYKNLKILPKNISKEKLDSIMHHFSMSLNVRCNFCHVRNNAEKKWDFASDSISDKLIARKMMLMTMNINKKYFKEERNDTRETELVPSVTCYTCHHGSTLPQTIPPPPPPRVPVPIPPAIKTDSSKQ